MSATMTENSDLKGPDTAGQQNGKDERMLLAYPIRSSMQFGSAIAFVEYELLITVRQSDAVEVLEAVSRLESRVLVMSL